MMKVKVELFSAGHAANIAKMVDRTQPFKVVHFPAICALITHPVHGYLLFDTGFSRAVLEGTSSFPMNLYRLITPVIFDDSESAVENLKRRGVDPAEINYVFLSHFHIDHMGGLKDFPNAKYIYSTEGFEASRGLTGFKAVLKAYLKDLEPDDMDKRSIRIEQFTHSISYPGFDKGFDIFGDGSIVAVDLPGHAPGQFGLFLQTEGGVVLLAADASWTSEAIENLSFPHPFVKLILHDYPAFEITLKKLHRLYKERPDVKILPTHSDKSLELTI